MYLLGLVTDGSDAFILFAIMVVAVFITMLITISR
jgi:hypothetical protein